MSSNLPRLYAFAFLKMTLFPMAVITLYWKDHIGLSLSDIMLLQGIFSVATLLFEYPSGVIADRLGYRYALTLATVIGLGGWGLYTVADTFVAVAAAETLLGIAFAFISGSDSALLFESLRAEGREGEYGRCDGIMTGSAQTGEALGALFAGAMYAAWPLLPFVLQLAVWLAALPLVRSLTEAPPQLRGSHQPTALRQALATGRAALIERPRLRAILLCGTLLGIASFYPVWLIQPFMQQCGVPLTWFGPVWAGANLTVALFSFGSARVTGFWGEDKTLWFFLVLIAAGYLGLGLTAGVWSFLFYYLLTAMRGLQGPLLRHQLQRESRRDNRASLLSLKSFAFRLAFVASGPLLGWYADRAGLASAFCLAGGCLVVLLVPALWLLQRNRPVAT